MTASEIARRARMRPICELVNERFAVGDQYIEPYGRYKAKLSLEFIQSLNDRRGGKLILVTAISPTPAGEGKTTTTIGLGDALNRMGQKTIICLREPSLGPCFGAKGGAAGGGYSQVVPMDEINLHFTGDFHAINLAHNLLASLVDNHIQHGNALGFDIRRIVWPRVMDLNDRSLRKITIGLGGPANGFPREDGFEICSRLGSHGYPMLSHLFQRPEKQAWKIIVGFTRNNLPVRARELKADGAMTVLLKESMKPNLVQTLENNLAFIHGGPFGNIAHGCNSVLATQTALKLADYVVTEAGFGADMGAEKFVDIKCRKSGIRPSLAVLVTTIRALKYHGGMEETALQQENLAALEKGIPNLERHINNVRNHYGLPCVVALRKKIADHGVEVVVATHWASAGEGAEELARTALRIMDTTPADFRLVYDDDDTLWTKLTKIATKIYGAREIVADSKVRTQIKQYQDNGYGRYPVCIAETQYSFSTDPQLRGAPSGHVVPVREVRLAGGAEFLLAICGEVMTMPGLPKEPRAALADIDENGNVVGLFG